MAAINRTENGMCRLVASSMATAIDFISRTVNNWWPFNSSLGGIRDEENEEERGMQIKRGWRREE